MSDLDAIRASFEEHGVKRVKLGGFDIDCVLRGKYVALDKFWSIVDGGMGFCDVIFGWDSGDQLYDRSKITGWHTGYPDTPAVVDLDTFRIVPWEPDTASFLLDFVDHKTKTPLAVSPRQLLRAMLARAQAAGVRPMMSVEYEFFIYEETPWSLRDKGFAEPRPIDPGMFGYSWLRTSQSSSLVQDLFDLCRDFQIPLEGFHTETGPGVFEAALRYDDALEAADRGALFKTAAKEICHRHGVMASFMAKPATKLPGCSGHIHQSLWTPDGKTNLFHDPQAASGFSEMGQAFLAGQLQLMPELLCMVAPNVNSYKRLLGGDWAPDAVSWGVENRTCAIRVIPGSAKSTRLEYRVAGADQNPYIAMAALIGAGLFGIDKKLAPPPMTEGNAYAADAPHLPSSLGAATEAMRRSEVAKELFGEDFVDHYLMTREWEVRQAERSVTDWEIERYFELA